jgi:hypothetical protein
MWDRISNLPFNVEYYGVCPATNGGYMACGKSENNKQARYTWVASWKSEQR